MMRPVIDRVLDDLLTRSFPNDVAACEQFPIRHQMIVGGLFQCRTSAGGGFVERFQQRFFRFLWGLVLFPDLQPARCLVPRDRSPSRSTREWSRPCRRDSRRSSSDRVASSCTDRPEPVRVLCVNVRLRDRALLEKFSKLHSLPPCGNYSRCVHPFHSGV